jgi:hypothetical protein
VLPLKAQLLCNSGVEVAELDDLRQRLGGLLERLMVLP